MTSDRAAKGFGQKVRVGPAAEGQGFEIGSTEHAQRFGQQEPPVNLFSFAEFFVEEEFNQKVWFQVIACRQVIECQPRG